MATIILYMLLTASTISTLFQSWIGVVAYYTLSLWYPQLIWFWAFAGIRAAFIVSTATIVGFSKDLVLGRLDFAVLRQKQNVYIVILWLSLVCSYFFAPYTDDSSRSLLLNSFSLLSYFSRIFFFYFISIMLIDSRKKCHYLVTVLIVVVLYYIYWANNEYFTVGFEYVNRLSGPGPRALEATGMSGGPYTDENTFAMLFVIGVPFLYFMGSYYQSKVIKYLLWLSIPWAWHAVFLTGSMGGLIGLVAVSLFIAMRAKQKSIRVALPILLLAAFLWQGGEYLKQKAMTGGGDITQVNTAQTRFDSWQAGLAMLAQHPITGVGLGAYLTVYSEYADTTPRVAHNTFFQFASEAGVIAGIMYLLLFLNVLRLYIKQRYLSAMGEDPFLLAVRESIMGSMIGFFVCSMALNLATYEPFYYLLILNAVQQKLLPVALQGETEGRLQEESIS